MNISKIENNQRTTTGRLPMAYLNHYITDLSELCRITGEDWRETALITPEFNAATHRLIETMEDGMLTVEVKSAEELAEEKKQTAIMELANTDNTTIRIVEDLTELLLKKGVILKSELPSKAVEKMGIRKQQRMIIAASDGVSIEEDVEYTGDSLWTTIKSWFGF